MKYMQSPPDEISDKLCDMGYVYSERAVEIRLISQGAELTEKQIDGAVDE